MTQEAIREAREVPGRKSSTLDGPEVPQPLDALKAWLGTAPPSPHDTEIRKLVRAAMGQVEELVTRSLAALHAETVEKQQCAALRYSVEHLPAAIKGVQVEGSWWWKQAERLEAALATDAGKDFVPRERLNEVARNAAHATREACVDALPDLRLDGAEACVRAVDVETIATEAAGAPSVLADVLRERSATHEAVLAHVHQQHAANEARLLGLVQQLGKAVEHLELCAPCSEDTDWKTNGCPGGVAAAEALAAYRALGGTSVGGIGADEKAAEGIVGVGR